jgi:hypothetical protein
VVQGGEIRRHQGGIGSREPSHRTQWRFRLDLG